MIQFTRLRLNGFKSFVDRTELEIAFGLNGIVGPNGCGKSNLVEALRWVMGENSAKRMRGGDMDDVIFAGTDKRSARNFAEVSLLLDNSSRRAPAAYNNTDEIEVIRRIERDHGSLYKINGKTVRARDVQMLFADTVTGANSPSLVSQGHVTRMINAKPHDRRLILEESAGIAGLYARRQEAEQRLKAADTNLIRVQDILGSMESRLSSLKRQTRQAAKYRNLSAQIKQYELMITFLEWSILKARLKEYHDKFSSAESIVAEKLAAVVQLTKTQATQAEDLHPLRRQEAEIAANLQSLKITKQRAEDDAKRDMLAMQEVKDQTAQTQNDMRREEASLQEAITLLERIQTEQTELLTQSQTEEHLIGEKLSQRNDLEQALQQAEERYSAMKETAAESKARQEALEKQIQSSRTRLSVLNNRIETARREIESLSINEDSIKKIQTLEQNVAECETNHGHLTATLEDLRLEIKSLEGMVELRRKDMQEAQSAHTGFMAEYAMLERFFKNKEDRNFIPVLDTITTEAGFEKALSRALGDSLLGATDPQAPAWWTHKDRAALGVWPDLPQGCRPLLPHIKAPAELHLALSQIGFVDSEEQGNALCLALACGQSLVSAEGTYWRWDGYIVRAGATDRHALHLEQKNKLRELDAKREGIESALSSAKNALDTALETHKQKKQAYEQCHSEIKATERKLAELRPALAKIREKTALAKSETERLQDTIDMMQEDLAQVQGSIALDESSIAVLLEKSSGQSLSTIEDLRAALSQQKTQYHEAMRAYDLLIQQKSTRQARIQAIADERISLQNRSIRAREHLKTLTQRHEALLAKMQEFKNQPKNQERESVDLADRISETEMLRQRAADKLAASEEELNLTNRALKEAEKILGDSREERAHAQATYSALLAQSQDMEGHILETLQMPPHEIKDHLAADLMSYQAQDLEKLKAEKDKLFKERDAIGPVNLRADDEAQDIEKELTQLLHERNDLLQAIDELRGAINKINKEARERLNIAFEHVNAHFQRLFVRLFGGGKAHLELINTEDPMGAGLEIFAQPPGKSLQSLSLLSGGEQTLASIALIFGMFLTNPSPICVLDEIDAPLDDSNVDRVCDLLEEIAERGETRFLVITHHRLSMARMQRLYGVTMAEKGVSQLVSVDLQRSFDFLDQAA